MSGDDKKKGGAKGAKGAKGATETPKVFAVVSEKGGVESEVDIVFSDHRWRFHRTARGDLECRIANASVALYFAAAGGYQVFELPRQDAEYLARPFNLSLATTSPARALAAAPKITSAAWARALAERAERRISSHPESAVVFAVFSLRADFLALADAVAESAAASNSG